MRCAYGRELAAAGARAAGDEGANARLTGRRLVHRLEFRGVCAALAERAGAVGSYVVAKSCVGATTRLRRRRFRSASDVVVANLHG